MQRGDRFSGIPGEQRPLSGFLSLLSCPQSPLSSQKSPPSVPAPPTRADSRRQIRDLTAGPPSVNSCHSLMKGLGCTDKFIFVNDPRVD